MGVLKYNYGDCFYASQTFNNVPVEDGRRIQMAGHIDFPEMPFNQMMTFRSCFKKYNKWSKDVCKSCE